MSESLNDDSGAPDEFSGRDSMAGGVLAVMGKSGAAPVYPEGPHCNIQGLSELGEAMIEGMVERGMLLRDTTVVSMRSWSSGQLENSGTAFRTAVETVVAMAINLPIILR